MDESQLHVDKIVVAPGLTLERVHSRFSGQLFELVRDQRDYLGEFLWWPHRISTPESASQYLRSVEQENLKGIAFSFFLVQDSRLVGGCGFSLQLKYTRAEMGFWLEENSRGNGLMSRALRTLIRYGFENLELHRIELRISPDNTRSLSMAKKMNFLVEGRMRDALSIGGSYQDMICRSLH